MDPAVTIVLPTFNRPRLLRRALASIAAQTFSDFEVIVIDDAGVDPTSVVESFADEIDLKLIRHPHNQGVTIAQNTGIAAARGTFIAFLGDDDLYHPAHLATLHEAASRRPGVIVYSDGEEVLEDAEGRELTRSQLPVPPTFDRTRLLIANYIPTICLFIPAAALQEVGHFDEGLAVLEDWDLWLRLSARFPMHRIPVVTCEYRLRGGRGNITTREAPPFSRLFAPGVRPAPCARR